MVDFIPQGAININDTVSLPTQTLIVTASASSVGDSTLTTILTYVNGADALITRISAGGEGYAKFQIFIDTVLKETRRGGPDRIVDFEFVNPLLLSEGSTLEVKVTHFSTGDSLTFESTMYASTV